MSNAEKKTTNGKVGLDLLREPFPPHQISSMCRSTKKDNQKGTCPKCKGWHGLPAIQLDYVGHAALTDRLLEADANWTWEPLAVGPDGYPVIDRDGGMWIRLTVCGVTRLGYGDAQGKTGGDAMKERIGDALRNAGMRFGAALELWHKGDLHVDEEDQKNEAKPQPTSKTSQKQDDAKQEGPEPDAEIIAQFNAAREVASLTRVMNSLPQDQKRLYTGHFNQRMTELKKAA